MKTKCKCFLYHWKIISGCLILIKKKKKTGHTIKFNKFLNIFLYLDLAIQENKIVLGNFVFNNPKMWPFLKSSFSF